MEFSLYRNVKLIFCITCNQSLNYLHTVLLTILTIKLHDAQMCIYSTNTSLFVANYLYIILLVLQTRSQARHRSVLSLTLAGGGGGGVGRGGLVGLRGDPGTAP